jgi:hypothetical protein
MFSDPLACESLNGHDQSTPSEAIAEIKRDRFIALTVLARSTSSRLSATGAGARSGDRMAPNNISAPTDTSRARQWYVKTMTSFIRVGQSRFICGRQESRPLLAVRARHRRVSPEE